MRFFLFIQSVIQRECSKKTLFCGRCCDRNQAIILVVLVLVSLIFICKSALVCVFEKAKEFEVLKWFVNIFVLFVIEKCVG